ncbi:hypothetical protein [Tsuneonella mangrovi]|uniref:hypothetical protein n=1 Tax=Tsuneonella mangrovi TaxID=1982042 RepID=UPI000BA214A3|nr:hypothetical protein [Tsuneonella mangrovi]
MPKRSNQFTPVMWLIFALSIFELAIRLPYLVLIYRDPYTPAAMRFQYFGIYDPVRVMVDGTLMVAIALILAFLAHALVPLRPVARQFRDRVVRLTWPFYFVAAGTVVAAVLGAYVLGFSEIAQNLSAKRDLDSSDSGILLYILLKASLFSHVLVSLSYMAYLSTHHRKYLVMVGGFALVTLVISVIFSQRAMLFVLGFELIYVTWLYRRLNVRKLVMYAAPFAAALVAIGIFRASNQQGMGLYDSILFGLDKVMSTRYFMNISKVGAVYEWQRVAGQIDFLSLNFLVEPFDPNHTIYFKDIGRMVSSEVFGVDTSGVTLGAVSEAVLSFGPLVGAVFCFAMFVGVFLAEKKMLEYRRLSLLVFFAVAKVPILLNTSLGSYVYQVVLESVLLLLLLPGVVFARPVYRKMRREPRGKRAPGPRPQPSGAVPG